MYIYMFIYVTVHEKTKHNALDNKSRYKPRKAPGLYFGDYDIFT